MHILRAPWRTSTAIVLVALNLRPAVVGVGPLLPEIRIELSMSATAGGLLTALPVLCFGLLAPVAPRLARLVGLERALFGVLTMIAAGCLLRMLPGQVTLYVGTVVIGAAIASGNVLLPAMIKRDFTHNLGKMTAVYSAAISLGGGLGAAVTVPLADAAGLGWHAALGAWALWAGLGIICWIPQLQRAGKRTSHGPRVGSIARRALAWHVAGYMGLQSLGFYAGSAWFAEIFMDRGWSPTLAGVLVSIVSVSGLVGSIVTPILATRAKDQRILALLVTAVGFLGVSLMLAPGLEVFASIVTGLGSGAALGLALTYIGLRSYDSHHAAQLSGMAQCVGYTLAAAGPFIVGAMHDVSGGWTAPLLALLLLFIPQAVFSYLAGRNQVVEPRII
ncbi:MFS transporter [Pseudonocardia sp. N23]|uniref:CynX/NimT family MFS transporter n=1 Tax=Pseudonocardia sp. N23 TaxID=1987376 RepID=UPI0021111411|nr:MFS transporter [Pseudonocardia sp. N23]